MNVTYADARNGRKVEGSKEGRKEGRGKLLKGWEGGWMYTYIHTRTKINYYKPLPFAYSHQFILLSCAEIPIPKPNPRAPDKVSSSLIYACRINLYLFPSPPTYLSSTLFPPFWTVSFHLLPRRVPAPVPAAELSTLLSTSTPIMRGPRYPVQIFSSTTVCTGAARDTNRGYWTMNYNSSSG